GFTTISWVRDDGTWKVAVAERVRKMSQAEYWDDMFKAPWGFNTKPNQLLVDTVKGVKPGTALDLATGQGRNSVFLATQGWKTTGIDVSKTGLALARENAAEHKTKLETIEADMDTYDLGKDKWDLVTMIYCGTNKKVVEKIKPSLKKGGLFVTEYFHEDSDAGKAGAGGWKTGELKALFADGYDILRDDVVDDIADWTMRKQKLVRFVARKK
ncbi:MAG: class I SAM-dependent methyltransferase, partial [Candidatus Eremiobacteraeota bacterium]|nr:class I SAM-dependent methyltransferase [Candidatus Eremiobacteraeota bacterium]